MDEAVPAVFAATKGSELAVAIGRRLGRLHTLTVKPWPPGATADPRALSRELGVDARLSGVATRTGEQLAIALRIVSTNGERALWEDAVEVPVSRCRASRSRACIRPCASPIERSTPSGGCSSASRASGLHA